MIGDLVGTYPQVNIDTWNAVISAAQSITDDPTVDQTTVDTVQSTLQTAKTTFLATAK